MRAEDHEVLTRLFKDTLHANEIHLPELSMNELLDELVEDVETAAQTAYENDVAERQERVIEQAQAMVKRKSSHNPDDCKTCPDKDLCDEAAKQNLPPNNSYLN